MITPGQGPALAAFDPFALIVLVFIALPILQGVFGRKQREEQSRQQDERRRTQQRRAGSAGEPAAPQTREQPESAADLVPDDLWELLTGEHRQHPQNPVPTREWREPAADVPASDVPAAGAPAEVPAQPPAPQPGWQAIPEPAPYRPVSERAEEDDQPWRVSDARSTAPPVHEQSADLPEAVSLEQPVPPADVRERMFHEELAQLPAAANAHRRRPPRYGLGRPIELRHAFILKEILGPPKGMQ